MGFLARLFRPKTLVRWAQFDGQPNTKLALAAKGAEYGPVLIAATLPLGQSLRGCVAHAVESTLLVESLLVTVHLTDRIAFEALGSERRSWFMDALLSDVVGRLRSLARDGSSASLAAAFTELYPVRMLEYADCQVSPPPKSSGGYDLQSAIGARLAAHLGANDPASHIAIIMSVADFAASFVAEVQLRQLLGDPVGRV